ncbi:hypothetical protein EV360DRAFT_69082 [Lentinula raphanica]|nr:hypothetical protein EV360DRAFT_69082 [Lentinula raphanica]
MPAFKYNVAYNRAGTTLVTFPSLASIADEATYLATGPRTRSRIEDRTYKDRTFIEDLDPSNKERQGTGASRNTSEDAEDPLVSRDDSRIRGTGPIISRTGPTVSRTGPTVPRADPAIPRVDHVVPQANPVIPRIDPAVPRINHAVPRADPAVPRADPVIPRADPVVPRADPVVPRADPVVPRADPAVPRADSVIPQTASSASSRRTEVNPYDNPKSRKIRWYMLCTDHSIDYPPNFPPNGFPDPEDHTLFVCNNTSYLHPQQGDGDGTTHGGPAPECVRVWIWSATERRWQDIRRGDDRIIKGKRFVLSLGQDYEPSWIQSSSYNKNKSNKRT